MGQCGLARAIVTYYRVDIAVPQIYLYIIHGSQATKSFGDVFGRENNGAHRVLSGAG